MTPYVINIKDLETTKFKRAKKRELVSGLDIELTLKKSLSKAGSKTQQIRQGVANPASSFRTLSETEAKLSAVQAQVSMDDLYVVQQLANKVAEEA